jgi:S-DNA-T family DNA segregation ATPase FtsK/SpoIIIE
VGRLASGYRRAVAAHREAAALLDAVRQATESVTSVDPRELREIVGRLRGVAAGMAPDWLGAELTAGVPSGLGGYPIGAGPIAVRIGIMCPLPDRLDPVTAPMLVPLLGGAHLTIDRDARDGRVASLLRCLVIRLLAACPPGSIRVATLDQGTLGGTLAPLRALVEAGALNEPATSSDAVHELLVDAERHARAAQAGLPGPGGGIGQDTEWLVLVAASGLAERAEAARLAALIHAGPAARVCVVAAGYPSPCHGEQSPGLGATTRLGVDDTGTARVCDSDGAFAVPLILDLEPPAATVRAVAAALGERIAVRSRLVFADILPSRHWAESSIDGLHTVVGRAGGADALLAFDDATPHWLVGGRTGAGKTVFLLDVLYGLAVRYSPDELSLYLLDFKEGISFTEFTPTARDPSWIPHARTVGIESDREYGVAVLRELCREMRHRARIFKRHGVTKLAELRRDRSGEAMPRAVVVIDEFQVLLQGNDGVAREATALLEELARKGRSYGIHLVLASQTVAGIETLYGKHESIFGQFSLRVALPGGSGVLDPLNIAADGLPVGTAIVNASAGLALANVTVRFPDAHADPAAVGALRRRLWSDRAPGAAPPAVFQGYAAAHVEDDPSFRGLLPAARRPLALVGRVVDVDLSTAAFALDATPGRHLAVVGTSPVGADVLRAATVSLGRQHPPGVAQFLVAGLVAAADEAVNETTALLRAAGQPVTTMDAAALRDQLRKLADPAAGPEHDRTFLVVFGVDGAAAVLGLRDPDTFRTGLDDLRAVLRNGPAYGLHVLGWWRGLRRLADDIGGTANREDIACLVALNVPGTELGLYLGQHDLVYTVRDNRALFIDRHDQRSALIVPYVRPGRLIEEA